MYKKLQHLHEGMVGVTVRARVSRLWLSIPNKDGPHTCNLMLLDEQDYAIHAIINPEIWMNFSNLIFEGNEYDISHFTTRYSSGILRPVRFDMCISFTHHTIDEHVFHNDQMIPFHHFDIEYIGNLRNILGTYYDPSSPRDSIDVMGFMEDLQPPRILQTMYGPKIVVEFSINDNTKTAKVIVCPITVPYVTTLFQEGLQYLVVVILSSVKICCDESMQLDNFVLL
ncbi:hypothetical protein POM88_011918 [Heracleum sosnowskyi]|uniref:Replication protein A 70 kDa DNA-binding subunit B/D first OB fold domain-containing protein n=1 Tax=Heracleum sosnowskyi TaxID=360622 RepID=A0AAD8IYT6_9APIA|nr:hypothetical protein POM88_011918 [Heracleum sosnowskyi]